MGEQVETLEDLLRPGLCAVFVGLNPAPRSVAAGHYYQGRLGQRFFDRLRRAGILPSSPDWEDDLAFANGLGFTDIIKRPTASQAELLPAEYTYGKPLLVEKIERVAPTLVVFTFKTTAAFIFGRFRGSGHTGHRLGQAEGVVMPNSFAPRATAVAQLAELRQLLSCDT